MSRETKFANDYEDEEEDQLNLFPLMDEKKKKRKKKKKKSSMKDKDKGDSSEINSTKISDELEKSQVKINKRKRRTDLSSDEDDETRIKLANKRSTYKNASKLAEKRTQEAFAAETEEEKQTELSTEVKYAEIETSGKASSSRADEEPAEEDDDAFLNLALEKARRLKRLQKLSKTATREENISAELQKIENKSIDSNATSSNNIVFETDSTLDFVSNLRNKVDTSSKKAKKGISFTSIKKPASNTVENVQASTDEMDIDEDEVGDMEQLAAENRNKLEEDVAIGNDLAKPVGRGLSSFLGILKSTGEVGGAKGGKEELRGRAKDERTYSDYDTLDLKETVKLDVKDRSRPDKDLEYANKEIKLEYRDDFGRLLTRKEAYRQMCYQFHGHGKLIHCCSVF